jgi:hypothetical protein
VLRLPMPAVIVLPLLQMPVQAVDSMSTSMSTTIIDGYGSQRRHYPLSPWAGLMCVNASIGEKDGRYMLVPAGMSLPQSWLFAWVIR